MQLPDSLFGVDPNIHHDKYGAISKVQYMTHHGSPHAM